MATPAFEEIAETFEFLDDWEERYRHVIEMGKAMPPLDDSFQVPAYKVDGCASQVWLVTEPQADGAVTFRGDSDAHIVRGLIAIVLDLYNGLTSDQVRDFDAQGAITRLGLSEALSSQRANGLASMIARLRADAAQTIR